MPVPREVSRAHYSGNPVGIDNELLTKTEVEYSAPNMSEVARRIEQKLSFTQLRNNVPEYEEFEEIDRSFYDIDAGLREYGFYGTEGMFEFKANQLGQPIRFQQQRIYPERVETFEF